MYFEGVCVLYRSSKRLHMKRWKSEMLQNYLENTWLDGRNAANSVQIRGWTSEMLQIACKTEGLGHHLGDHTIWGGVAARTGTIYIYMYTSYTHIHTMESKATSVWDPMAILSTSPAPTPPRRRSVSQALVQHGTADLWRMVCLFHGKSHL